MLNNVINNPQEEKFQRVRLEKFRSSEAKGLGLFGASRTRVSDLDGAVAALEACGFQLKEDALVMDAHYARTQGMRLREAQRKVEAIHTVDRL